MTVNFDFPLYLFLNDFSLMPNPTFSGDPHTHFITEPLSSFTPLELANGDLRMAIAVSGQHAYNFWGEEATLTEEFLAKDYRTWEGGLISTNHEDTNDLLGGASLYDLEYDAEKKLVIASFANLPDKAKAFIKSEFYQGLSQECIPLRFKNNSSDVIAGYGTGVTIVMWPHQPAATQEMGVGVRPELAAILSFKYPSKIESEDFMVDKQGGGTPAISTEAYESAVSRNVQLESRVSALELNNNKLSDELDSWKKKYTDLESGEAKRTEIAIESARKSWESDLKAKAEMEGAVTELKAIMSEDAAKNYLATNPTVDQIKSITAIMRANSATQVGSSKGSEPPEEKSSVSIQFTPDPYTGKLNAEVK